MSAVVRGLPLRELVADGARTAEADGGPCTVCGHLIRDGQRVADLASGAGTVHIAQCSDAAMRQGR